MKFDLKKPCGKMCPFHVQCLKGWLGEDRATEIAEALEHQDQTFACHKTTEVDDEGDSYTTSNSQHCAGAMIMLERMENTNQLMRIAERVGSYDRHKLDMESPVFDNTELFINHHS